MQTSMIGTTAKKRRPTSGRPFKGSANRTGIYFTVSFKKADLPVYQQVQRIADNNSIPASEIMVDACRLQFGSSDVHLLADSLLQRYAIRQLEGPELFKTFRDVLEWELKYTPHVEIPIKWGISAQQFAVLLYLYGSDCRTELRTYKKK